MTDKERYRAFAEQEKNLPLFLQPWWLDAVTEPDGKQWEVLLAFNKQGETEAALPYLIGKKLGLRYMLTPQLTQYTGVWIRQQAEKRTTDRLEREKKMQTALIEQIHVIRPALFELRFPPQYTNWLPFYWAGFHQETRYTYRIEDLSNMEKVWSAFSYAKQKQINKAKDELLIDYSMSTEEFYALQSKQWATKGERNVLSKRLVEHVIETARGRGQGMIVRAKDKDGHTHAAIFVAWDEHSAYELMSAIHPDFRASGASTLVVWEGMKRLSKTTRAWDFEGSMIESVENSFRQFGATQTPYFVITKNDFLGKLYHLCKR